MDELYKSKFVDIPNIIADWAGSLADRDILDFGCGDGTIALGIALHHNPHRITGIDTHDVMNLVLPQARQQIGRDQLPDNLKLVRVVEDASLEALGTFDLIYSWSVFEHVRQDLITGCFAKMRRALRTGGLMFLQTTPLYYSSEGSHMKPWVPQPWAHLMMQHDLFRYAFRAAANERADELQSVYETLNRQTASQLLSAARDAGFDIIREYRTKDAVEPPAELLEIYNEDIVTTNQLVFLARPSSQS